MRHRGWRLVLLQVVVLWTGVPNCASGLQPPLSRFAERKAEALLRDALPCLGCHTLSGDGGRLGPDLTTVRSRRSSEYVATIIADPQRVVPGTPMPLTALPQATRDLITRYIATRPAGNSTAVALGGGQRPPPATSPRDARTLYANYCAGCHGATGRGDGPNAAYLPVKPAVHASKEAMSSRTDDALFDAIAGGGAIMNRSPRMPAFGATLSAPDIRSIVRHIRSLCGCRGPAWSADGAAPPPSAARQPR